MASKEVLQNFGTKEAVWLDDGHLLFAPLKGGNLTTRVSSKDSRGDDGTQDR